MAHACLLCVCWVCSCVLTGDVCEKVCIFVLLCICVGVCVWVNNNTSSVLELFLVSSSYVQQRLVGNIVFSISSSIFHSAEFISWQEAMTDPSADVMKLLYFQVDFSGWQDEKVLLKYFLYRREPLFMLTHQTDVLSSVNTTISREAVNFGPRQKSRRRGQGWQISHKLRRDGHFLLNSSLLTMQVPRELSSLAFMTHSCLFLSSFCPLLQIFPSVFFK